MIKKINLNCIQKMSKSRHYDQSNQYEAVKNQLERETAALLAERRNIDAAFPQRQTPANPIRQPRSQSVGITPIVLDRNQENKKTQEVVNRLQEIIKLCKEEGALSNEQMREIIKVESQVLHFLQKTATEPEPNVVKTENDSPQVTKSKALISEGAQQGYQQTWGKPHITNHALSQDTIQIIAEIERKALGEIVHLQRERDKLKEERDHLLAELQKGKNDPSRTNNFQFQKLREENKFLKINADQFERLKEEIRILRGNNVEIQKIRDENRLLREQNHLLSGRTENIPPNVLKDHFRQTDYRSTHHEYPDYKSDLAHGQYDSQIAVYQNQLRRATVVINQLRSRLAHVPGIEDLHDQGERIRRQTAELLQLKSNGGVHSSQDFALIKELQERLQEQQRGKAAFLDELKSFKQRYIELQQQNKALKKSKVSFDPFPKQVGSTPQRQSHSGKGIMKKRASYLGDYEQTLNEMKRALY